ncbi:MAG: bifunctional folylpolyglutamate synthase/dihydrofolate synthase [Candidatus Dormibacteria bacterium]
MDYGEALEFISATGRFGIKMGLERTRVLLDAVGTPDRGLRGVLVGGTNGKGSTCAHLVSVLRAAGLRTGSMPKPHLASYTERICVDGLPISEADFAALVTEIEPVVAAATVAHGAPTEFEMLTAAAILHLARVPVDALVCEVGMGGRLDSTNVLQLGVKVITGVDLDHQRYLGNDLAAIAHEKAGIVHPGDHLVSGPLAPAAEAVVAARVDAVGATWWKADRDFAWTVTPAGWQGSRIDLRIASAPAALARMDELHTPLVGEHQATNAAVAATAAVAAAIKHGFPVDPAAIRAGLSATSWPGRLELVEYPLASLGAAAAGRRLVIDGAHNPAAVLRIVGEARRLAAGDPVTILFGAMADKDWPAMLALLPPDWPLVLTAVAEDRAASPEDLLGALHRDGGATPLAVSGTGPALRAALELTPRGGMVLVLGSLYLAGAVRREVGLR